MTKSSSFLDIVSCYSNKLITSTSNTEFLGIVIENLLSQEAHVDQLTPNLCTACCAIRAVKLFMSLDTPKVDILYLCSLSYELWNNNLGHSSHSVPALTLHKRVIRIITRSRSRDSCRELLKKLKILPFQTHYLFSLLQYVVNSKDQYKLICEVHSINTKQTSNLFQPLSNFTTCQKGTFYFWHQGF